MIPSPERRERYQGHEIVPTILRLGAPVHFKLLRLRARRPAQLLAIFNTREDARRAAALLAKPPHLRGCEDVGQ